MSTAHQIGRILTAIAADLWAILPEKACAIRELLAIRATGQRLQPEEIRAAIGTAAAAPPGRHAARGVAVVPVNGVLAPRMNMVLQASGGTSTETLVRDVRALVADDRVSALMLVFNSPGGSCAGLTEAAAGIRRARGTKPIWGIASHQAASAAYVLLAQCDRVIASPSADVGSLGVLTMHEDLSGAQQQLGVKTTLISAGKYKTEGHPFAPLSDEARATIQRRVDSTYRQLVADVAAGRGVSEAEVKAFFGEGRLLDARDARAGGLVDDIGTLDDVIGELASLAGAQAPASRSALATRQNRRESVARQELALDDWHRKVALDLRLLDL